MLQRTNCSAITETKHHSEAYWKHCPHQ